MNKILDYWYEYKAKIIASIVFFAFCLLIFWGVYFFNTLKAKADGFSDDGSIILDKIDNTSNLVDTKKTNIPTEKVKVDIKGYIKKPGVYELSNESRIIDVITVAGGLKDGADTSSINLSKKVFDEMVIVIYSDKEVKNIVETRTNEEKKLNDCENNNKITNDACIDLNNEINSNKANNNIDSKNVSNKININTASLDELENLNGVGESKARSIIEYRSENGKFKSIDEILNVKGIGSALFEKIKNNITI